MSRIRGKTITEATVVHAGVDVSKAHLDLHVLEAEGRGTARRFGNDLAGIATLVATLGELAGGLACRVAFEPTGRLHLGLWRGLAEAGLGAVPIDPFRARHFAEADGQKAKTDRIDARVLARAGALLDLQEKQPPTEEALQIKELQRLRDGVTDTLAAAKARRRAAIEPFARRLIDDQIAFLADQKAALDAEIHRLVSADPQAARRREIVASIPGFAPVTATSLIVGMPELGTLGPKRAAALIGAAPMDRESGTRSHRARPRGGRRSLAARLHMSTLAAARANPDIRRFRERLRANGKPAKLIATAVLRKLVILADTLIREDRLWTPQKP